MYPRKRFDIGWSDLAAGYAATRARSDGAAERARVERWFDGGAGDAIACLSVRSGLDLLLTCLALPRGSEVLMSALTIPDMVRVVEHHGLVVVPVDVDPDTLAPRPESWRRALTPRTRAAIPVHLFGARSDFAALYELRKESGLLVFEDCAQAFVGETWRGDERADVSMFSFGPIKTATALAGAVLRVRDAGVLARMRALQATWPVQDQRRYRGRILKYAGLKALSSRAAYTPFAAWCSLRGSSLDQVIQRTVRGFPGADLFAQIRAQPCPALLALLARQLEGSDSARIAERARRARALIDALGTSVALPGRAAPVHSHWVFTLLSSQPDELVRALREGGFDATRVATMSAVPSPAGRGGEPREARDLVAHVVYLPLHPGMSPRTLRRIAALVLAVEGRLRAEPPLDQPAAAGS